MATKLYNKELNITGEDVSNCSDIEQLQYWEEKLTTQLRDIKATLEQYDDLKKLNPELVLDSDYIKLIDGKKYRLQFLDIVLARKKALKNVINKDQLLTRKLMSVAKDWLEPKVYKAILEEAKKRAGF